MIKTRNSQWLSYIYSQICTHTSLKRLPLTYEIQSFQKLGSWLKTSLVNFSTNATRWGVLHLHAKGEKKVTVLIYFWIKSENLFEQLLHPQLTSQQGSGAVRSPGSLTAGQGGGQGSSSPTGRKGAVLLTSPVLSAGAPEGRLLLWQINHRPCKKHTYLQVTDKVSHSLKGDNKTQTLNTEHSQCLRNNKTWLARMKAGERESERENWEKTS